MIFNEQSEYVATNRTWPKAPRPGLSLSAASNDPFGTPDPNSVMGGSPNQQGFKSVTPCDNGVRFGAWALDFLLAVVTCGIGWLIWAIVLWNQGTSPAKKMLGLVVVDLSTGQPANMGKMAMRELVGKWLLGSISFGVTTLVGGIMILASDKRQGIWDQIAGTTVCRRS
jgi:uncharacterized RDD family membrane protein YckC